MTITNQCECGSAIFASVIQTRPNGRRIEGVLMLQCAACGCVHRQDSSEKWQRLEFNGADGEWSEAPD